MESICVIGLGYVGLPLAIEFSKKYNVFGFDINQNRIDELKSFVDHTLEVSSDDLKKTSLKFTSKNEDIKFCTT